MTTLFGWVDAFDEKMGSWEHYFDANGIKNKNLDDNAKKKAVLLSVCGSKIYKLT